MVVMLKGSWPAVLPIVIQWLSDHAGVKALTAIPENLSDSLPAVVVSPAPGGTLDIGTYTNMAGVDIAVVVSLAPGGTLDGAYTNLAGVDIDVFAADHDSLDALACRLTNVLAVLQGAGNQYGYVDASTLTSFSEIADDDPNVLRCTATITLQTRPQNIQQ